MNIQKLHHGAWPEGCFFWHFVRPSLGDAIPNCSIASSVPCYSVQLYLQNGGGGKGSMCLSMVTLVRGNKYLFLKSSANHSGGNPQRLQKGAKKEKKRKEKKRLCLSYNYYNICYCSSNQGPKECLEDFQGSEVRCLCMINQCPWLAFK